MAFHIEVSSGFWLVVSILATWRLTSLLHYERGPWGLLEFSRQALSRTGFRGLVECFHCAGIWCALGVVALLYRPSATWIPLVFAVAGGLPCSSSWSMLARASDWSRHQKPRRPNPPRKVKLMAKKDSGCCGRGKAGGSKQQLGKSRAGKGGAARVAGVRSLGQRASFARPVGARR